MRLITPLSANLQIFNSAIEDAFPSPTSKETRRWLALGDSYTIGESVPEDDRWPVQLASMLQSHGYSIKLTIIARTGWTCEELWAGIRTTPLDAAYDLVSLLIGVNNQYRGLGLDDYRQQFRFILDKAIGYAGKLPRRVLVFSIPDWGVTPFASGKDRERIAAEIDRFNAVNHEEASSSGANYVDITAESRRDGQNKDFIAPDGLHPAGKMYTEWARLALPVALLALQDS